LAPALDELPDELPLGAAGVLKLIHQQVPVAGLEAKAALGEFVHLLEQPHRTLEDAGEIEQRVRLERLLVLAQRDREDPPDAARHHRVEVAPETLDRVGDERRDRRRARAMAPPRVLRIAFGGAEAGASELLAARAAVLGQEVRAQAIDARAKCRLRRAVVV